MKKFARYIRTHRRRWALTQDELAFLLGFKSGSSVSRLETGKLQPSVEVAVACGALFGMKLRELFPHYYVATEDLLMRRAYEFDKRIESDPSKEALIKRTLLRSALARAKDRITKPRQ